MRNFALVMALFFAVSAWGQGKPTLSHHKKATVGVKADLPVTQAEAATVFAKAESILRRVNHLTAPSKPVIARSSAPVSRALIVREMDRLYELAKPAFKITPRPVRFDPKVFSMKDQASAAALKRLVDRGCIARVGPLATSPKESLSVEDFGDALGFFLLRLSELTHMPSTKWSPYLQTSG